MAPRQYISKLILWLLLSYLTIHCHSQSLDLLHKTKLHQSILPAGDIKNFEIDKHGFTWIASWADGLVRWDGNSAHRFYRKEKSPYSGSSTAWDIHIDEDHRTIIVSTGDELLSYNLEDGRFSTSNIYTTFPQLKELSPYVLKQIDNKLWITFSNNIIVTIDHNGEHELLDFSSTIDLDLKLIVDIIKLEDSTMLAVGEWGILKFDQHDTSTRAIHTSQFQGELANSMIRQIIPISTSEFILATWNRGLLLFEIGDNIHNATRISRPKINHIRHCLKESDKLVVEYHNENGNKELTDIYKLKYQESKLNITLQDSALDSRGLFREILPNVYLGGTQHGIQTSRFNNQCEYIPIPPNVGIADRRHCTKLLVTDRTIYCLFFLGGGIYEYDRKYHTWEFHPITDEYGDKIIGFEDIIFSLQGDIVGVAHNHVFAFDTVTAIPKVWQHQTTMGNKYIAQNKKGDYWIGTRNHGLHRIDSSFNYIKNYTSELSKNKSENYKGWFYPVAVDKYDNVWIRNKYGVAQFDPTLDSINNHYYEEDKNSPIRHISGILPVDDKVWLFGSGIAHFNIDDPAELKPSKNIQINDDEPFYYTGQMKDSTFIVSYSTRLFIYENDSLACFPIETKVRMHSRPAVEHDSILWTANAKELFRANLQNTRTIPAAPKAYVKHVFEQDSQLHAYVPFGNNEKVVIGKGTKLIKLELGSICYEDAANLEYRYRLNDGNWTRLGKETLISLVMNSPGKHQLVVQSRHRYMDWQGPTYELGIDILPHWYQTRLFRFLTIFFSASILASLLYFYFKRKEQKRKLEQHLVELELRLLRGQMKPHFIFNCLNTMDGLILTRRPEEASDFLSKFSKLIRSSLELSRARKIPVATEIEFISRYLEIERIKLSNRFNFSVKINHPKEAQQHNIIPFLIQPFVENAIKHGVGNKTQGGQITIADSLIGDQYQLEIIDNGPGFHPTASVNKRKSLALKITEERLKLLNTKQESKYSIQIVNVSDMDPKTTGCKVVIQIN